MNILNKLTLKNLKLNKTRTIVTIIGIMLSTILIMSVAGMTTSMQQTMIADQINFTGDQELYFKNTNSEFIEKINTNRDVQEVYVQSELGCAVAPNARNEYRPYINLVGLTKNSFENGFNIKLSEGRFPENENEVIVTVDSLVSYDSDLKVGDKITLDLGTRIASNGEVLSDFDDLAEFIYNEYDDEGNVTLEVTESIENTQPKALTVVGIIKNGTGFQLLGESWSACNSMITLVNDYTDAKKINAYVNIKPESEKNFIEITEHITGLSNSSVEALWSTDPFFMVYSTEENAATQLLKEEIEQNENFDSVVANTMLLDYKGYSVSESSMKSFYTFVLLGAFVIVFASAFIIRNSFAISITEKTKLYGKLISVGATPKQVKRNVLFEGIVLGLIGVSLGLILGAGVVALLIWLMNLLLSDFLYGSVFVYSLPWWVPFFTIGMSALVIFFSTYAAADRASKIAPVVAIRGNNYVKLSKNKKKYKTPAYIKKIFGIGGDIAYKNLKRNKKKYRTTVISIIVSISIFITVSSFVDYGMKYSKNMYGEIKHNFIVYGCTEEQGDVITSFDGLTDVIRVKDNYNTYVKGFNGFSDAYKANDEFYDPTDPYYTSDTHYLTGIILEEEYFKEFVEAFEFDYEQVKDKAIIYNVFNYADEKGKLCSDRLFDISKDAKFDITFNADDSNDGSVKCEVTGVDFGGEIITSHIPFDNLFPLYSGTVILSESWAENNINNASMFNSTIYMNCEDPEELRDAINELGYYNVECENHQEFIDQIDNFILVISIFAYGFITVISLIGVTNIFNTVSTNMNLRRKDFAILRSVGMTKKEFNKMIKLETLFYGAKALAIGLPLGILGSILVFIAYNDMSAYSSAYMFPWVAVLLCVVCVFALLWFIIKYSFSKIKKQNIIETIRNDNI